MVKKGRVFSGARPTGRQHIGNYLGAIQNYVALQKDYHCVYSIVDWHALTTLTDTRELRNNTFEMALDWLSAGMDPDESIIFVQSQVPQVAELALMLSMVTPMGSLVRMPTFKEKVREQPDNVNYGLLGYPVLMAADITLYKADIVPVGEDQAPHLEFTREIVRKFNARYGEVLVEPKIVLTPVPKVLGTDGANKMGKSLDNHIELGATPEEIKRRVMGMVTDPARKFRNDPGHPEICNVHTLHKIFNSDPDRVKQIEADCRKGTVGCVEHKRLFAEDLLKALAPLQARRAELAQNPKQVWDILENGATRARLIAAETMRQVRSAIGID